MVRTLIGNGFSVQNVTQKPGYTLISCSRYDEFGGQISYEFALFDGRLGSAATSAILHHASGMKAYPVLVGSGELPDTSGVSYLDWWQFLGRCGGAIKSWLPLQPHFSFNLVELGHNRKVRGLIGRPDDLFEQHVHAALQFVLADQVVRYGQNRRGEVLPDGGALGRRQPIFLYDAKAYRKGYPLSRDSIRQFADYVVGFHTKYEQYIGRLTSFLLVSGHFADSASNLLKRSQELFAESGVPLSFLTATELGSITEALSKKPALRNILNCKKTLARVIVTIDDIKRDIRAATKDGLIR